MGRTLFIYGLSNKKKLGLRGWIMFKYPARKMASRSARERENRYSV